MKKSIPTFFCFLFFCQLSAQINNQPKESPGEYFNNFQKFTNDSLDADSAFYYVRKLASKERYTSILRELLHNSFAQEFIQKDNAGTADTDKLNAAKKRLVLSRELLLKMASDTTRLLQEAIRPLYLLVKIQDAGDDISSLSGLTNEFINKEVLPGDMYKNLAGRYGLMIYKIISGKAALKLSAEQLLTQIKLHLKTNQVKLTDSSSRMELDKRAWYRYLYAYVNYTEAGLTNDINKKESFLKTAFTFSPDLVDLNHNAAFFYEMGFLLDDEKTSFKDAYLTFLLHSVTDKQKVLATLLQMSLAEPEYKPQLKDYYTSNHSTGKSFNNYWIDAINGSAKTAPLILLNLVSKKPISSKQLLGKWILVDFWGTWCMPCRQEHPDMQKFYDSVVLQKAGSISLLTIACRDTESKVTTYMNEKHFTFPVAMSDTKVENQYLVQGYPTKILITPAGKYITVPFGVDWIDFVKQYCNL